MPISRKLALYSDQEGPDNGPMDQRLLQLIGKHRPRLGYVSAEPDPQRYYFESKRQYYAALEVVLGDYVDAHSTASQWQALLGCDAIHLSGGNTFVFLQWLREQGRLADLTRYVAQGGVLIGVSAGAILMTPGVLSAELCGDERGEFSGEHRGLALVDFHVWPHFAAQDDAVSDLAPLYGLPDGGGIIVDGQRTEFFGGVAVLGGGREG